MKIKGKLYFFILGPSDRTMNTIFVMIPLFSDFIQSKKNYSLLSNNIEISIILSLVMNLRTYISSLALINLSNRKCRFGIYVILKRGPFIIVRCYSMSNKIKKKIHVVRIVETTVKKLVSSDLMPITP